MTVKDIMHSICNGRGISLREAAGNMGIHQSTIWRQLDRNNGMTIKLETLIRYLGDLECEVYVLDPMTEEEYILDGFEEEVKLERSKNFEGW